MADIFTKKKRSEVMAAIRSHGNKATEVRMAALFRAHGITGWRRQQKLRAGRKGVSAKSAVNSQRSTLNAQPAVLRVRVDFVFRSARVAVFVDGCFWHACPRHGTQPSGNRAFWKKKLARNVERDREVSRALRKAGWTVLRVWECALSRARAGRTLARIARALHAQGLRNGMRSGSKD